MTAAANSVSERIAEVEQGARARRLADGDFQRANIADGRPPVSSGR